MPQLFKKKIEYNCRKSKREQGTQQIKHLESLMRECIAVKSPSIFFGSTSTQPIE